MKQRTIANRGKQENQGNMDSYVLFLWALKPFATRNTFWHLTLSFLHDLPFSRTRHGTHQGATTSESTHQIRLKWLGFCGPQKKKTLDLSSHLVWSGVTFKERIRAIHSLEVTSVDMISISFQSISLLNFKCWHHKKKMKGIEFIGIHFPTFPIFTQKNMDYLSSQASLASFLLHGHMQITRRCNLENHVTGCSFWSMFNGRISQKKNGTKLTSWLKT